MSRETPKTQFPTPDDSDGKGAGYDPAQLERETGRDRVPFSTSLDAGLYEKLKTMAFYKEGQIADVVNGAVRLAIAELERKRGEPYKVPEPLKINE